MGGGTAVFTTVLMDFHRGPGGWVGVDCTYYGCFFGCIISWSALVYLGYFVLLFELDGWNCIYGFRGVFGTSIMASIDRTGRISFPSVSAVLNVGGSQHGMQGGKPAATASASMPWLQCVVGQARPPVPEIRTTAGWPSLPGHYSSGGSYQPVSVTLALHRAYFAPPSVASMLMNRICAQYYSA